MSFLDPDEIDWSNESVVKLLNLVTERAENSRTALDSKQTNWDDTNYHRGRLGMCRELLKLQEAGTPPE